MQQDNPKKEALDALRGVIMQKKEQPVAGSKVTLDWRAGEMALCEMLADPAIQEKLTSLQQQCFKGKIACFYSFFVMQKSTRGVVSPQKIEEERMAIAAETSKYHSIRGYIRMREHLLARVNKASTTNSKALFEDIDDIRFLNLEIVGLIQKWKEEWRVEGGLEPVFYDGSINYLLKISNDNAELINLVNFKKTKFVSPPNPFFLTEDGNLQGMPAKHRQDIAECVEIINKQRAIDLRMSVQGGILIAKPQQAAKSINKGNTHPRSSYNSLRKQKVESSFVLEAKNEMKSVKEEEIRKIYKINKALSSTKIKANQEKVANIEIRKTSQQEKETEKLKMYSSQKRSSKSTKKIIKQPQQHILLQSKLISKHTVTPSQVNSSIRNQINKVVNDLGQTQSPIKKKEVRQTKPKIKLIQQKSSAVDLPKGINISTLIRPLSRKNSTFYKKIQPILQQNDEMQKQTQQNFKKRTLSHSNFYTKQKKKQEVREQKPEKQVQDSVLIRKKEAQSQIRTLNSQIKSLTIINIYKGKKEMKRSGNKSLSTIKVQHPQVQQNASFITEIDAQLKIDASKYSSTYEKLKTQNDIEISKLTQEIEKKSMKKTRNEELLQQKERRRLEAQKELQLKSLVISELEEKIKGLQGQKQGIRKKEDIKKHHTKDYERTKKVRQIQSKILKDKIKSQQEKFMAHREMELKLRQEQLKKEFKKSVKSLETETLKRKKEYEKRLVEEERRMKQTEKLIQKQKNRFKDVENQLQQKKLKEKLLRKIVEEKEEMVAKHLQDEKDLQRSLEHEMKLREKMELESIELLEKEKKKMEDFYQEMIAKNKQIQEENLKKMKELNEIDEERAKQLQKMKEMQQQFQKLIKSAHEAKQQEEKPQEDTHDMQGLKLQLKQELLTEIMKKKAKEEQQELEEDQRRQRRLRKIEEQVAQVMKAEEEALQKENEQFMKKLEYLKEVSLIPSTHQKQAQAIQKFERLDVSQIVKEEPQQQQDVQTFELALLNPVSQNNEEETANKAQQAPQVKESKVSVVADVKEEKIEKAQQNPSKIIASPISPTKFTPEAASPSKIQRKQSVEQPKIQPQDILSKHKNLIPYFKKTKIQVIQDKAISIFLDNFLSQQQKMTREMLPYSKFQLQRILSNKKVDIFEYGSIGWLQQGQKYNLIGGLQCVQNIGKKYGAVQVHQVMIFDKTNPYQKQYLAKKMKQFEITGFVYQKKLPEANKYSIRFVIKLPKEIYGDIKSSKLIITSRISLERHREATQSIEEHMKSFSFGYLASRILKQNLEKAQFQALVDRPDHFRQVLKKQMYYGLYAHNCKHLSVEQINDSLIQIQMRLPFKALRTLERGFFLASCTVYSFEQRHFYVFYPEEGLAIILHETVGTSLPLDYLLFNTIEAINAGSKIGSTEVVMPIWQYDSSSVLQQGNLQIAHREKLQIQLSLGSIASTFLLKQQHVELRPPFVVGWCEVSKEGKLLRPLSGHVITDRITTLHSLK